MKTQRYVVTKTGHPGSTKEELEQEASGLSSHRIGYRRLDGGARVAGTLGDWHQDEGVTYEQNQRETRATHDNKGLVTVRDVLDREKDFTFIHPEHHIAARYVLDVTEKWIKDEQDWPINKKKREKEQHEKDEKDKKDDKDDKKDDKKDDRKDDKDDKKDDSGEDDEYKRRKSSSGHSSRSTKDVEHDPKDKLNPQDRALLKALMDEAEHLSSLENNDGKNLSPLANYNERQISVDEQDTMSPDNWIPRFRNLIRLTGKHPLNAESDLTTLFEAGLITPNKLHYVRNHGAVPRLKWEDHQLHVLDTPFISKPKSYSMDDITQFDWINIAVALACDGNRRKELNLIKRSKGFDWGAGAVSCAYWKGALLRDVLLDCCVKSAGSSQRWYVHFEGAEELSEGKYGTCLPLEYVMSETNDVMLAYEMNNVSLAPDHGYPLRLLIPGYVGGRCVKWLQKIWVSDQPSTNHYHIWDNRVVPSFVTEMDGPFAKTMFSHPDTACMEQNLNSVICRPAHGEFIKVDSESTYRIQGYAYDGGGHMVQKVEVSLDGGQSWLYAMRTFPKSPIRHSNKFWTWLHWHVDVKVSSLLDAKEISVRAWNVFKNTQPDKPTWNIMGMMQNSVYKILPSVVVKENKLMLTFKHPVLPGAKEGGWIEPSREIEIEKAQQSVGDNGKKFTKEEIEKHNNDKSCWIVVDGQVYDATSVLSWHPGGKHAILGHAGLVHIETTNEFQSIHDDYATKKLLECHLGSVSDKAKAQMKKDAERAAKDSSDEFALKKHEWFPAKLLKRQKLSHNASRYTFASPEKKPFGLNIGQHVLVGFHLSDQMVFRAYTPVRPVLTSEDNGTFDLVVKTYFPSSDSPGGTMSNILDKIKIGESIDLKGPTGDIVYKGNGIFSIDDEEHEYQTVNLIGGGTGSTPHYQLIHKILSSDGDKTKVNFIYANSTEEDILLRKDFESLAESKQFKLTHVLSKPSDDWQGEKGHVDEHIIKSYLAPPDPSTAVFLCGPPPMIAAATKVLKSWGFKDDKNLFGF